jgi:hypothetical protein
MSTTVPVRPSLSRISVETSTSLSQSGPRTDRSMGKPRAAEKPCCDRSWTTARRPGYEFSSLRSTAWKAAWLMRSPGGFKVSISRPELMLPPRKLPTTAKVRATSGRDMQKASARLSSLSVSWMLLPTAVCRRTLRRL